MCNSLSKALCMLLSGFMQAEFARKFKAGKVTERAVESSENYLPSDKTLTVFCYHVTYAFQSESTYIVA